MVKPILKFHFKRDEFLGRINEFVYFLPFSDSELRQLVEFQLKMWKRISLEKHSIQLDWTEARVTSIFRKFSKIFNPKFFDSLRISRVCVLAANETMTSVLALEQL